MKAKDCEIGMIVVSNINALDIEYEVLKKNRTTCTVRTKDKEGFVYTGVKYSILTPKNI